MFCRHLIIDFGNAMLFFFFKCWKLSSFFSGPILNYYSYCCYYSYGVYACAHVHALVYDLF